MNLREVGGVSGVLRFRVQASLAPERHVNAVDSMVGLGCWAKGRSPSLLLNGCLRRDIGWHVLGLKHISNVYVYTKHNVADDPTRKVTLREPAPCPEWLRYIVAPNLHLALTFSPHFAAPPWAASASQVKLA